MKGQAGVSLIEVLVALLIMSLALLGAAALQVNSLKYTDSARLRTQASFVAYDMMERIRANNGVNYTLANLGSAPASGSATDPKIQDLFDFGQNVTAMGGTAASITLVNSVYTVSITWDDSRAGSMYSGDNSAGTGAATQTFTLTSRVAAPATTTTTSQ